MPNFLVELTDGRKFQVEADTPPTEADLQQYMGQSEAPKEEPMIDVSDTLKAAGQAIGGIATTAPHAFRQLYSGLENPWQRSEGYKASQSAQDAYQQELEAANQAAVESGDISTSSRGMRQAGQSLGFSAGAMGAGLVGSSVTGLAGRGIGTAIAGPAGAATGEVIGRGVGALGAGYGAAYRMAGAQFLDDASKEIDAKFMEKLGRLPNEQEQKEAYDELLPLAQAFGHAEAGPEAIGNLAMAKAGKFILGLGINKVKGLAAGALAKVGAGAGGLATELGGETVTQVEQNRLEEQKNALLSGQAPPEQGGRTVEEYQKALGEVAPATLATMGLIGSVPTAYKAGELAVKAYKQPANEAAAKLLHAASVSSDDTELTNKATEEQIQDSVDATVVNGLGEDLSRFQPPDPQAANDFEEQLRRTQEEGAAADIQAAQMRAQEEAAQAQAAADRQAQFEGLSQNEPAITTPVGGAIPAVEQEEAAAIQPEQQLPDGLGVLPAEQPQTVGQEPQAEMVGTTTTNSGVAVPSNLTNSVGTVQFLSRDDPNRLLLEDGFAYRTVSEGEVNHFAQEGALLTDPNLAGQKKKSRGQTSQKMFSHINLEHPEYGYRPNQLVIRVPINRIPIGTKGVAIRAKDAEVMRFDGGKWVGTPVSELAQPQAETTSPVTEMARQAAAINAGTERGSNLKFPQTTNEIPSTKTATQGKSTETKGTKLASKGKVGASSAVSSGTGAELQQQPATLPSISEQHEATKTAGELEAYTPPNVSGASGNVVETNAQKFAAKVRAQFKADELADKAEKLKEKYYSINASAGKKESEAKDKTFLQWKQTEAKAKQAKADAFAELRKQNKDFTLAQLEDKEPFMVAKTLEQHGLTKKATDMGYVRKGDTFTLEQPISPQGEAPTGIATQTGQPMPGGSGVAVEKDATSRTLSEAQQQASETLKEAMNAGKGRFNGRNIDVIVSPSSRPDVMLQITRLSKTGEPQGHQDIKTEKDFEDALADPDTLDVVLDHIRPDIGQGRVLKGFGVPKFRKPVLFKYRLRLRDVGPGTAPKGFISSDGRDVAYDHPLTLQEMQDFEIDPVGATAAPKQLSPAPTQETPSSPAAKLEKEGVVPASSSETEAGGRSNTPVETKETPQGEVSSGKVEAGNTALDGIISQLPQVAQAKYTPEVRAKAAKFFESKNEADLKGLTTIQKTKVHEALYRADKEAADAQKAADKLYEKRLREEEKENARLEKEREKQAKETESRREAIDSLTKPTPAAPSIIEESQDAEINSALSAQDKQVAAQDLGFEAWGEASLKAFKSAYTDWLVSAISATKRLAQIFYRLANSAKSLIIGASIAISPQVGESTIVPAQDIVSQARKAPVEDIMEGQVRVTATIGAAVSVSKFKGIDADFHGVKAPQEVVMMAQWVMRLKDNKNKPFLIASKNSGEVYVFDNSGRLAKKSPALFGQDKGDSLSGEKKITPSGRFDASIDVDANNEYNYGRTLDFLEKEDSVLAVHRVYLAKPEQKREDRLKSKSPVDNRISSGCINVTDSVFDRVIDPLFSASGGVVYVMPETGNPMDLIAGIKQSMSDSIVGTPTGVEMKAVSEADGQEALAAVNNSGDVPGVLNAFVGTSGQFLANPENEANFPDLWKILSAGRVDEGNFAYGRAFVFTDGIGVNASDRRNAERLGVTPSVAAVRRVLIHESLVHRGIYGLPAHLQMQILQWVRQNTTPEQLDNLARDYPQYENWRNNPQQMLGLCEEYLAKTVEKITKFPKDGPLSKLFNILKDIWRWMTGETGEPTVQNLRDVVKLLKAGVEAADARLVNGGKVDIKESRPSFASPINAELARAAERFRQMQERQAVETPEGLKELFNPNAQGSGTTNKLFEQVVTPQQIRSEIRAAYDRAILGTGSIQTSLQSVYDEAKTQIPTLTEKQFGEQLQALYEDGSAFLVPADRSDTMMAAGEKWGVYDASGMPASYVGVMPSEVKASVARRPNINIPNEIKEQARILGKEGDMALNRHRALKALQEAQPKFHIKQDDEAIVAVAINIVDALKSAGVTPQELNGLLTDPEFLDDLGIPIDSSLYQAVAMEMYRSQQDEVSRLEKEGKAAAANKLRQYVSAMQKQWYESGTRGGQRLNVRLQLINNPRYQGLFLATHLNESMREAAQAKVEAQTDIKAEDVAKANDTAGAEAADDVAAEIEELEMAELDRLGEEQLDDAEKPLWQQIKGYITKLGAIAYARLQKASGNIKASNAAESASDMVRRYISMPDKEIDAEEADIHQKLKAAMKKFMGKGTETQKKVKKDLVDRTTEVAKKPRAKRAPKVETVEQKAKLEKAKKDKANATAARIIYRTEELFRQGFKNDIRSGQDKPSIYKEFIQQIQEPTDLDGFAARLAKLKVSREVAERMFRTAALEKTDREAVRNERNRIRLQELREKQAMQLVYLTEQNLRQSGIKGIQDRTASENDSVRKAFKDQVNAGKEDAELAKPLTEEEFVKRLAALKVRPEVAKIMFKTADRERADIEASDKFDLLESPRALRNMMRKLAELRMADKTPFLKPISWKKLFSLSKGTQEQRRAEMEDAIRADESLQNLSEEDQKKLADLIEAAWNSQREKVFKTEIDRLTRLKKTSEKAKKAITDSTEKLLEMVNQGVLDNDELYALLAEKFGFKPLTQEQKAEIEDIAQKLQGDLPPYKRTQLVSKFKDIITKTADVPFAQKAADWWVTAVLTGPRTAFTIGLGFLSGGYQVLSNALVTVARHSGDINAWKVAGASINDWVASMPRNAQNALGYLWDGREDRLDPTMSNISSWLNLDKKSLTQTDTASVLLNSKNPISRLAGGFMTFFKRLLVALDMFNAASAKDGSLAMSYYQTRQSQDAPFSLKELSSLRDFKAARDYVLGTEFGGVEPTNPVQKSLLDAWASQYMWQQIAKFEGIVENATYNAQQGAMSLDPSGLGGHLYHAILGTQAKAKESSEKFLQGAKKDFLRADNATEKAVAYNKMALAYFYHFAAYNMLGAVGLKFARYAGNRLNQTISFVPVLGAFRLHETEGVPREMHRSQIIANQAMGSLVTIIALALMKEMADEPDEEKRGWGWEGSWDTLTPERKSQRMSAGKQAYTLTIGGKTFKYNNWPMGGVMAAVGSLMDMIQYSPDKWNERTIPGKVASAGLAALLSVGDSASLSQFSEMFGRSVQTRDPLDAVGNTLSKTAANYAGGFIPRIFKDVDKMFVNPEINRYKTPFEFMAREVPIYRSSVGKPMLDIFAKPVAPAAGPTSREFITQPTEPEYRQIGRLNERGIWLTSANPENRLVGKGSKKRHMTDEEGLRYIKATGNAYREFVLRNTDKILSMTPERGKQYVLDKADEIRDRAAKQSIKR